ncbi:MAG: PEP-CTERM sorting domain-containing protein [Myxococcota bacterium]|nr:PEP-CTERM sorting domain-containing protein [Myxococcales bacterium]
MKAKIFLATIASLTLAGSAQATLIAGWDFSQYAAGGFLSTNGINAVATLDANYSDLDPTFNAGAESAAYGTMYMDGTYGSTDVTPLLDTFAETFQPFDGSLSSGLTTPFPIPFDSHTVLASEGQTFQNFLSLAPNFGEQGSVVFEAALGSLLGDTWSLSFGGLAFGGTGASQALVEVAFDGGAYSSVGNANLTGVDTLFSFNLGATAANSVQVRLSLDSTSTISMIDNVAISAGNVVPEPGTGLLVTSGLLGLAAMGRRRN